LRVVEDWFKKIWYSVKINSPYWWTIVPSEFNGTNSNVYSIMIEINRKLYLDKCSKEKSKNYSEVMANIQKVLSEVRDSVF
jgi:N-formylglutamate amidohydrolase